MPLYIVKKTSKFEIDNNESSFFVYFDTLKEDSIDSSTLLLRNKKNALPISYANHMSANGYWTEEEFKKYHKKKVSEQFSLFERTCLSHSLVVFPIQTFVIIRSAFNENIGKFFDKKLSIIFNKAGPYKELI